MSFTAPAIPPKSCSRCKTLEQSMASNRSSYETHLTQVKTKYTEKEAECHQLRQTVAKLQAQLKSSEKKVEQLSTANAAMGKMYNENAEYVRLAQTAEKTAAEAKKQVTGWKLLARKRKNAMLKAKKENVALTAELKKLQRGPTNRRRGVEAARKTTTTLPSADAQDGDPVRHLTTPTEAADAQLTSNRGKPLAILDNYLYKLDMPNKARTVQSWRCIYQTSGAHRGCKGRATSAMGSTQLTLTQPHSHEPALGEIEKRRRRLEVHAPAGGHIQ